MCWWSPRSPALGPNSSWSHFFFHPLSILFSFFLSFLFLPLFLFLFSWPCGAVGYQVGHVSIRAAFLICLRETHTKFLWTVNPFPLLPSFLFFLPRFPLSLLYILRVCWWHFYLSSSEFLKISWIVITRNTPALPMDTHVNKILPRWERVWIVSCYGAFVSMSVCCCVFE